MLTMSASTGRADDAEGDGFRNGDDGAERLFCGPKVGDGGDVFNDAEEIGTLDEDATRFLQ